MALDDGQAEIDELIAEIEKIIRMYYTQAKQELEDKILDYWQGSLQKEKTMKAMLDAGDITLKEYNAWRAGQLIVGSRWEELKANIAQDLTNAVNIAKSIVNGHLPDAYSVGFNYGTFTVEKAARVDTSFVLYDRPTVERLIREKPQLLPALNPLSKTAQEIADGKIIAWHEQQIQSVAMQGMLQGESIPEIAQRISDITLQDETTTSRYARTMMNGAENAGRNDSYIRANEMGIELEVTWLATLDERTRHSHRLLDRQTRPVDGCFEVDDEAVGHVKIRYPCELGGKDYKIPQSMIWNCRCSLAANVKGLALDYSTRVLRSDAKDYETWKQGRSKSKKEQKAKEKATKATTKPKVQPKAKPKAQKKKKRKDESKGGG